MTLDFLENQNSQKIKFIEKSNHIFDMIIRHSIQNNDKYSTALNPLVITCFLSSSIFLFYNLFFHSLHSLCAQDIQLMAYIITYT